MQWAQQTRPHFRVMAEGGSVSGPPSLITGNGKVENVQTRVSSVAAPVGRVRRAQKSFVLMSQISRTSQVTRPMVLADQMALLSAASAAVAGPVDHTGVLGHTCKSCCPAVTLTLFSAALISSYPYHQGLMWVASEADTLHSVCSQHCARYNPTTRPRCVRL
jgi:hypothetical protein